MNKKEFLRIGFLQTNIDNDTAWGPDSKISLRMKEEAEFFAFQEIKKGFHNLYTSGDKPDIIVLPELTLPLGYKYELQKLANQMKSVVFAGLDYTINEPNSGKLKQLNNRAILIVPRDWIKESGSKTLAEYYIGKYCPANVEDISIKSFNYQNPKLEDIEFSPDSHIYIAESELFGKIGFAICADFYDIEKYIAYKGKVQHIIIIAYNKDSSSFFALAEAVSRLVMCNVIICNTGKFGDSIAFSPYKEHHQRIIYRHQGADQFMTQIVKLPVSQLYKEQEDDSVKKGIFKKPPGYKYYKSKNKCL
jgi:hypothetical protein